MSEFPIAPPPPPAVDDPSAEFAAAAARESAFAAMFGRLWRGVSLLPWSKERDSLLTRLIACDLPGDSLADLPRVLEHAAGLRAKLLAQGVKEVPEVDEVIDYGRYLPEAAKLLYLASHEPEAFQSLRARPALFISAIEEWSAANIGDDEVAAACVLAAEIRNGWRQFRPMVRPSRRGGDEGN